MVHHLDLLAVCVAGSIGVTLNVLVLLLLLHERGGSISIVVPRLMKQIVFVHVRRSHAGFLLDLNLGRLREENLLSAHNFLYFFGLTCTEVRNLVSSGKLPLTNNFV
jgi:hypothetical protein